MLYNVVIDPPVLKELLRIKKGSPHVFSHLKKSIDSLAHDSMAGKPLKGSKKGCFSLREGDYRVIYEIYVKDKVIHIIAVGHRKEIYR